MLVGEVNVQLGIIVELHSWFLRRGDFMNTHNMLCLSG